MLSNKNGLSQGRYRGNLAGMNIEGIRTELASIVKVQYASREVGTGATAPSRTTEFPERRCVSARITALTASLDLPLVASPTTQSPQTYLSRCLYVWCEPRNDLAGLFPGGGAMAAVSWIRWCRREFLTFWVWC
jgi:hypothetical protein